MPEVTPVAETPDIHRTIASIGTKLATSGRNPARDQAVLKFGPEWGNQWGACPADIVGVVKDAREALFGKAARRRDVPGVAYAPQFTSTIIDPGVFTDSGGQRFLNVTAGEEDLPKVRLDQPRDTRVVHEFWESFTPRLDPTEDWTLLAGHLQHLYVELVTIVLAGEDPRPTLLKMIAMEPAAEAVDMATHRTRNASAPYIHNRSFIVMQNWKADPGKAVQQIREFLQKHAPVKCSVKADPNGGYIVKPAGLPAVNVAVNEHLAVEMETGNVVTFAGTEIKVRGR